jgi:small redox-active disulfide protein 2
MNVQDLKPVSLDIKILGTGCPKCRALEKATNEAVREGKLNASVSKVEDIMEIMEFGVMTTPALVMNDKILVSGKVPSVKDLIKLLTNNQ